MYSCDHAHDPITREAQITFKNEEANFQSTAFGFDSLVLLLLGLLEQLHHVLLFAEE